MVLGFKGSEIHLAKSLGKFLNERNEDPARLYVTFLYSPLSESKLNNLILFTAARVRILAPAHDEAYTNTAPDHTQIKVNDRIVFQGHTTRDRGTLLTGYLTFSLSFSIGTGVFLFLFLFLILGADISSTVIISGLVGIAAFQLFNFVTDLFLLGRLSPRRAEMLLEHSMGRVALLYLAVVVGVFLTLMVEQWFVLPFAVLKTIVDLARPIQAFSA